MNEEHPTSEEPSEAPLGESQRHEAQPLETQSQDPVRRLRELLAIPDRERTDAVWDEIIGLEIQLAPGNRAALPQAEGRRQEPGQRQPSGRRPVQARRQESTSGAKATKRFFKRSKRGPGT